MLLTHCPLVDVIASISSKYIIEGDNSRALATIPLIFFSDSPTHFDINSGPLTVIKLKVPLQSQSTLRVVFPQNHVPGRKQIEYRL